MNVCVCVYTTQHKRDAVARCRPGHDRCAKGASLLRRPSFDVVVLRLRDRNCTGPVSSGSPKAEEEGTPKFFSPRKRARAIKRPLHLSSRPPEKNVIVLGRLASAMIARNDGEKRRISLIYRGREALCYFFIFFSDQTRDCPLSIRDKELYSFPGCCALGR